MLNRTKGTPHKSGTNCSRMENEAILDSSQNSVWDPPIAVAYSILVFVLFGLRAKKHAVGPILAFFAHFLRLPPGGPEKGRIRIENS